MNDKRVLWNNQFNYPFQDGIPVIDLNVPKPVFFFFCIRGHMYLSDINLIRMSKECPFKL